MSRCPAVPRCPAALSSLVPGAVTSTAVGLLFCKGPTGETPKCFWLCLAPWGTSSRSPVWHDVPRAGMGQEQSVPKPRLKGTETFPSSCTWGRWVGAGDSHWERASSVLVPIRPCPAPPQGHVLGPFASWQPPRSLWCRCSPLPALHCPQHLPGQRPVPRPRSSEVTHQPVPLRAQGQECDVALCVQAQPMAALGPRHWAPTATAVLRQHSLQHPLVVHVPGAGDR